MEIEYTDVEITVLEAVWGDGFLSPGGPAHLAEIVRGLDLRDQRVLDIGCGIGGFDFELAETYGAQVVGIDVEAPLIERAQRGIADRGLEGRVEVHLYEPGPLPFVDSSFDVVFGKDAWLHIPDKGAFFEEVHRVLRPDGLIAAGDWCCAPGEFTDAMLRFFEAEDLTYSMEPHDAYRTYMEAAGFVDVTITEFAADYLVTAREEADRFRGELREPMMAAVGQEYYDGTLASWDALVEVLDERSLLPSRIRARKES